MNRYRAIIEYDRFFIALLFIQAAKINYFKALLPTKKMLKLTHQIQSLQKIMINLRKTIPILSVSLIAIFLYSCGGSGKTSEEQANSEFDAAQSQIVEEIDKVVHELPPPSEVPYLLQATGSDFNPELVNKLENAEKYYTSLDKSAFNLGGYATDIGYLATYDQVQDALKYMETCQKLSETIGIASAFDLDLMERFERNLSNRDSLSNLINLAMKMAEDKLEDTDRLSMVALVLSGSYIEGLYLSVMVVDTYPDDLLPEESKNLILEPLVRIIIDQRKSLIDVIALLKDLEQDEIISNVIAEFNILRSIYKDDVAAIEEKIHEGDPNFRLNKDMLANIIVEVKRIRADMIE